MVVERDKFPIGLRVLVVDDNLPCLRILERLLVKCKYEVTITTEAVKALKMLKENKDKFDIIISDVHMPEMDGFKLLELIGLELDLPVIMLSANDDPKLVMKGVRHGAVDYLLKPVRIEELKNIWQHVIRKTQCSKQKGKAVSERDPEGDGSAPLSVDGHVNANSEDTKSRKRKDQNNAGGDDEHEGDEDNEGRNENTESTTQKKPRVVWSPELHKKFVAAVDQLGPEKAFPKKILDFMNVEGITRENVASHLQKYRLYLKRLNTSANQPTNAATTPFGIQDSYIYMNPYGAYSGLGGGVGSSALGQMNAASGYRCSGLSQDASSLGKCLRSNQNVGNHRSRDMDHFQNRSNNSNNNNSRAMSGSQGLLAAGPSEVKQCPGVPSLSDYTKCMQTWINGSTITRSTSHQNMMSRSHLSSSSSFNAGLSSTDISYIQNALERSFFDTSADLGAQNVDTKGGQYSFTAQNVAYNNTGNTLTQNIEFSNQSFGQNSSVQYNSLFDSPAPQISGDSSSSFMPNTRAQDSDADALMRLDEGYLLEEDSELLAEFTQNNCETLEDLVGGLLKQDEI